MRWTLCAMLLASATRAETAKRGTAEPADVREGTGPFAVPDFVHFQARRLTLDPRSERIELQGRVVMGFERYRLTSDRLTLERTPKGLDVEGPGQVAFCPDPDPPVTLGFRSALAAPPGDLLLFQPTLRIGTVPVLWFPVLWLRSRNRPGLLPLHLGYRGADGPVLGSGVHLPAGESAVDLTALAYTKGGVDAEVLATTPRTTTRIRWDYLGTGMLQADLRGSAEPARAASVSVSADTLRGARALGGPVTLEEASLRQDRARVAVVYGGDAVVASVLGVADGRRGAGALGPANFGPGAFVGTSTALGGWATLHADSSLVTLHLVPGSNATLAGASLEGRGGGALGAVRLDSTLHARSLAMVLDEDVGRLLAGRASLEAAVPLVREYGPRDAPAEQWLTPFLGVSAGGSVTARPLPLETPIPDGGFYTASCGLRTTLGETAGHRAALGASLSAGLLGDAAGRWPIELLGVAGRTGIFSTRTEIVRIESGDRPSLAIARAELGRDGGLFLSGRVVAASAPVPAAARILTDPGWNAPRVTWVEGAGTSLGGSAGVPFTHWLGTRGDVDYDLTHRTLLGVRGRVSYLHPCRCLAVGFSAGTRLGRAGGVPDAWISVDLAP